VSASFDIEPLQDRGAWDSFVRAHPQGTFFHLSGWQRVLKRAFGHRSYYLVARREANIVGVLPLARVKSLLFGDALISTPLCVYGGAVGAPEAVIALEDRAAALARELQVDHLELRNRTVTRSAGDAWPVKELYVTFRRPLDPDPEKNLAAIPRKQRAEVRAGLKNQLQTEFDSSTQRFFQIYSRNMRALGTPAFSRRYFDILREEFGADCEIATVTHESRPLASLMTFWFGNEVLPYYCGGLPAARALSGYDYLYWDLMCRAVQRGCQVYDFGRSKLDTGPYKYKKHWGFEPEPLPYAYHLVRRNTLPNLTPTNPKYYRAVELWKRLPLPATQLLGPWLARYLG
jgi:FemAB-related protein (PEP-CTERM system-associated)